METTTNKNTKYTDKYFFLNRIKTITDTSIKIQLNTKMVMFLNSIKEKNT
jgi:hypothetical protein